MRIGAQLPPVTPTKTPATASQIAGNVFMTDKLDWSDPADALLAVGRVALCASPLLGTGLNLVGALGFEDKPLRQKMMGAFTANVAGYVTLAAGHPLAGAGLLAVSGYLGARGMIESGR